MELALPTWTLVTTPIALCYLLAPLLTRKIYRNTEPDGATEYVLPALALLLAPLAVPAYFIHIALLQPVVIPIYTKIFLGPPHTRT